MSFSFEIEYKLMRVVQANPRMSQREIARELGISLGKVNYCLQALINRGWIKVVNFTNTRNKAAYLYLLTPRGIEQKASLTLRFLQAKMREYEVLRAEINQMQREAGLGADADNGRRGVSVRRWRRAKADRMDRRRALSADTGGSRGMNNE